MVAPLVKLKQRTSNTPAYIFKFLYFRYYIFLYSIKKLIENKLSFQSLLHSLNLATIETKLIILKMAETFEKTEDLNSSQQFLDSLEFNPFFKLPINHNPKVRWYNTKKYIF